MTSMNYFDSSRKNLTILKWKSVMEMHANEPFSVISWREQVAFQ